MRKLWRWLRHPRGMWKLHHLDEVQKRLLREALGAGRWGRHCLNPEEIRALRELERCGIVRVWPPEV
jgi:hypothetical protein